MIEVDQIIEYIKTHQGLVFVHDDIADDAPILNIGYTLAEELSKIDLNISCLPMMAEEILCKVLDRAISESGESGVVIVSNINILFEKRLALDVASILRRYSRNCLVVIRTDGEIKENSFFPFGIGNGINIKLDNIPISEI